jgi:hypothetical protein
VEEVDVVTSARAQTQPGRTPLINAGRQNPSRERVLKLGHERAGPALLRAQEVIRAPRASAPASRKRTMRADANGVVSRAQSYLRIPPC